MGRRTSSFIVAAVFALVAVTATAFATKPINPRLGWFEGPTSEEGPHRAAVKVVKVGDRRAVGLNIGIEIKCTGEGEPLIQGVSLTTKNLVSWDPKGNMGGPVPVENGKFSRKRTLSFEALTIKAEVSGTFKSASKVVGAVSLSEGKVSYAPGVTCASGKVTFTATHR